MRVTIRNTDTTHVAFSLALLLAACSSSNDGASHLLVDNNLTTPIENTTDLTSNDTGKNSAEHTVDSTDATTGAVDSETTDTTQTNNAPDANTDDTASNTDSTDSSSGLIDSLALNVTQVNFGIMVPAYQSNALQIRIVWGDKDLKASWIGDEMR